MGRNAGKRTRKNTGKRQPEAPDLDLDPAFDPIVDLSRLVERERDRSGPGTAARRALEALAESRRLREQLDDLEDFDADTQDSDGSRAGGYR